MNLVTVKEINSEAIIFSNGYQLISEHDQDCCENHYLDFSDLVLDDFKHCLFDLDSEFFEKIEDYGIAIIPINNHKIRIPEYGYNNGYYSSELILTIIDENFKKVKSWDISDCQIITD